MASSISLLACSRPRGAVVTRRGDALHVKSAAQVLDHIDVALPPIDVNFSTFLAPLDGHSVRHDNLSSGVMRSRTRSIAPK
jgi:hypothetical protein